MSLADLKLQLEQARAVALTNAKNQSEEFQVRQQLAVVTSPSYVTTLAKKATVEATVNKLAEILDQAKAVLDIMPSYNARTKQDRKWSGRPLYGFGIELNLVYQILSGTLYASRDHKDLILSQLGLSEPVVEALVESFGNPSYYSLRDQMIVDATPFDIDTMSELLTIVAMQWDITIPMNKVTAANFTARFNQERERALQQQKDAELSQMTLGHVSFTMDNTAT